MLNLDAAKDGTHIPRMADVFISSSSKAPDRDIARMIAQSLEKHGISAFFQETVSPGENWYKQLASALDRARVMVVLISPQAAASQSVSKEIDFALTAPRLAERIIPVVIKRTTGLPWILDTLEPITLEGDGRKTAELVAEAVKRKLAQARALRRRKIAHRTKSRKAARAQTA